MSALKLVLPPPDRDQEDTAREARALVRLAGVLVGLLFGAFGLWAVLAQLQAAVIGQGVTKVEANVKAVQPPDGGVVRAIFVTEGARVRAGDPIMELEDVDAHAALAGLRDQFDAALARQARLAAEMRGATTLEFPEALRVRAGNPAVRNLMASERALFEARRALLAGQAVRLREQARAIEAQIRSNDAQVAAAEKSLGYLRQQEAMHETLHEQRFVSQARLLDARRGAAEKEEKKFEFEALGASARQRLAEVEMRLASLRAAQVAEATRDQVENDSRLLELQERLKPARQAVERRIVRAPVSGTVNVLRMHTVGGVVGARDTIAEIVPEAVALVAEVRIDPADIEDVREGQPVEIELSGFNRRAVPLIAGRLVFVSPEAQQDANVPGLRYFTARAAFAAPLPAGVEVTPGMPVTVYLATGSRTPLELWLDPLLGGLRQAAREK